MTRQEVKAPELMVERWFNSADPITLESLRGRPVLLHSFQMLCPGCVAHAIPQVKRIAAMFREADLAVIGLHTVFEHHQAMTPVSLEAFLHEYQITFPVGVDQPSENGPIPRTMAAYGFRGTPSLVLIDRGGYIRHHGFGQEDDIALGFRLGMLMAEKAPVQSSDAADRSAVCDADGCAAPLPG
ncbi:redoxin domain-containing protein [Mesorhizobium sp. Root157]|uniref:redoxin domain-containing protein n=1 Tax=Mesorhizobium sp. Root157 TaxID=1736477 RepID=UPI0009E6C6B7|nr:redoxin domain-containing protein [Mesorhizobium sp. Root157]